jgi:hypothetical protein
LGVLYSFVFWLRIFLVVITAIVGKTVFFLLFCTVVVSLWWREILRLGFVVDVSWFSDVLVGGGELQILLNKHYCPRQQTNGKEAEEEHKAGFSTASLLAIDWGFFCLFVSSSSVVVPVTKVRRK